MDFVCLSPYTQCDSKIELVPILGAVPIAKPIICEAEPGTQTTKDDDNNNKIIIIITKYEENDNGVPDAVATEASEIVTRNGRKLHRN
jgi:hypothetical protein